MREIKKILLPTDLSQTHDAGLPYAVRLAKALGAELHLFHATVLHDYHPLGGEKDFPETAPLLETLSNRSRELLARLPVERSKTLVVKEAEARGTAPAPLILEYATEHAVDLIVMATHGRRGLRRFWLGSVAEDVVRHATCPVMTLHEESSHSAPTDGVRIIVSVDFSELSAEALSWAARFGSLLNGELHLLHVIEQPVQPVFYEAFTQLEPRIAEDLAKTARRELETLAGQGELGALKVQCHVKSGFAASEILTFSEREGCGLIVMGSHGLTGLAHVLLGSVAEQVVRKASCPVLTVKPSP